jgi:hypothetical protein
MVNNVYKIQQLKNVRQVQLQVVLIIKFMIIVIIKLAIGMILQMLVQSLHVLYSLKKVVFCFCQLTQNQLHFANGIQLQMHVKT